MATANNGDRRFAKAGGFPEYIEQTGRIGEIEQAAGIGGIIEC
jgi:hypothetical protein